MIYSKKRYVCSRYYSNHMKVRSIMRLIKSENIRFILKLPSSDCILSKYETWSGFKQLNKINPVILGLHWDLVFGPSLSTILAWLVGPSYLVLCWWLVVVVVVTDKVLTTSISFLLTISICLCLKTTTHCLIHFYARDEGYHDQVR